jgi:hypothetical protein
LVRDLEVLIGNRKVEIGNQPMSTLTDIKRKRGLVSIKSGLVKNFKCTLKIRER